MMDKAKVFGYTPHEDMPADLRLGYESNENFGEVIRLKQTASTFELHLIHAFTVASANNRLQLVTAFPFLFVLRQEFMDLADEWWRDYHSNLCPSCEGSGTVTIGKGPHEDTAPCLCMEPDPPGS